MICSQLESPHSMCSISEKVKRFLENNFKKILKSHEKHSQFLENSQFFYFEFFLIFFVFLFGRATCDSDFWPNLIRILCKKPRNPPLCDSLPRFALPLFHAVHISARTRIYKTLFAFGRRCMPPPESLFLYFGVTNRSEKTESMHFSV